MKRFFTFLALICACAYGQLVYAADPQCEYSLIMWDTSADGWSGGKLTLTDGNGAQNFEITSGKYSDTVKVNYYGGGIVASWTDGSNDLEVGFKLVSSNEEVFLEHMYGTTFTDFPATISYDPCATPTNKYTLILADDYGDGWNGGKLTIQDNNGSRTYTLANDGIHDDGKNDTVEVCYFGGDIKLEWIAGGYVAEVGFKLVSQAGEVFFEHQINTDFSNFPVTITWDPFATPIGKYDLIMSDGSGYGWNGGKLTLQDNNGPREFSLAAYNDTVEVSYFGGEIKGSFAGSTSPSYVGFKLVSKGGEVLYEHKQGYTYFPDFTITADPLAVPLCSYFLVQSDEYGDGWNGGELTLTDGNYPARTFTISSGSLDTVKVNYYGGGIKGKWTVGSYDYEIGFQLLTKSGELLFEHKEGSQAFPDFEIPADEDLCAPIGNVAVSLLIPSDCGIDISKDIFFVWKGRDVDPGEHSVKLSQDGSTRFWRATAAIPDYAFTYDIKSEISSTEKLFIAGSSDWLQEREVCLEAGPVKNAVEISGVTTYERYHFDTGCDAKDHNYNVDPATAKAEASPGQLKFNWMPYQDAAYSYYLELEYDNGSTTGITVSKVPYTYKWSNLTEMKFVKWSVTPNITPTQIIGEKFVKEEALTVEPTPFVIDHVTAAQVTGTNTYEISWDVIPEAGSFYVQVVDPYSMTIVDEVFQVSDLTVKDGKYVLTTPPMSDAGTCYIYITAYDKDGSYRADKNTNFDIAAGALQGVGEVNVAIFIPTDVCDFNLASTDFYINWQNGDGSQYVKATRNGAWFTAKLNVTKPSYRIRIGDDVAANWSSAHVASSTEYFTATNVKLYVSKVSGFWYLYETEEDLVDHDWRIKDVAVEANADAGTYDVTLTTVDRADHYYVYLYTNVSDASAYTFHKIEPASAEPGDFTVTLQSDLTYSPHSIEKVAVYAYEKGDKLICGGSLTKNISFMIPLSPQYPRGLKATVNDNHTVTCEWQVAEGVAFYRAEIYYGSSTILLDSLIDVSKHTPVDGKYTVTLDQLYGNGTYTFYVYAQDMTYSNIAVADKSFDVTNSPALGDVTLRVLIPTDNNFPDGDGPRIFQQKLNGAVTELTSTMNGHWLTATFNTTESAFRCFVANKADYSAEKSEVSDIITSNSACFELRYNASYVYGYKTWSMKEADCSAEDHDYRITDITWDNSQAGLLTATIATTNVASRYGFAWSEHGSSSYQTLDAIDTEGKVTLTIPWPYTTDRTIDIQTYIYDEDGYQLAPYFEQTTGIDVKGNPSIPKDLDYAISEENHIYSATLSWICGGTVDHYGVRMYNTSGDVYRNDALSGTSVSIPLYIEGDYYWGVTAYASNGQYLGYAESSFYFYSPDLTPYDLDANVALRTFTLSWDAPESVNKSLYYVYDAYSYDSITSGVVSREGGLFSAQYTYTEKRNTKLEWSVISLADDGETAISHYAYGSSFVIYGMEPDPAPETLATLTIKAGEGGSVNTIVNGTYEKGTNVTLSAFADANWYFDQWSDGETSDVYTLTLTQDTVLEAFFLSNIKYTVHVLPATNGTVTCSVEDGMYAGGTLIHLEAQAAAGYRFKQWSDGNQDAKRDVVLTGNLNIEAQFAQYFTVTFMADDQVLGTPQEVESGTAAVAPTAPAKEGYDFKEWDKDFSHVTADMTVKAVYTLKTFTVKFVDHDGTTVLKTETVEWDKSATAPENPTREGYTFKEWDTDFSHVKSDLTVKAVYEVQTFTVKFVDWDDTELKKETVEYGKAATPPANPTRSGYTFKGWDTEDYKNVKKNLTVKAVYEANSQALDDVNADPTAVRKVLINGELFILRDGKMYTVQGAEVR